MTEIILNLAALLLALFCLAYGLRRRPGALPRRGLSALRGDAHALLSAMAAMLALCAAAAVAEGLALAFGAGAGAGVLSGLRGAQPVLQIGLLIAFILYVAALLTRGGNASAALPLLLVAAVGVAVRAIWHVRVDLFFEAVALFGATALRRRGEDPRGADRRFRGGATAAVALTLLAVIIMNVALILNLSRAQSDEIGNTQLDVISSDLQDTITEAQTHVLRVAIGAEQLIESGASREALSDYLDAQRDKYLANPDFMNVYIAGRNWHIIPDFEVPENFHASERVWYIGAQDCPGEVYISEPYVDASTGDMCFTVSTLLSDGETVAGMDLNFSKAQESILRMTRGRDQTAMIVTSGGLIAGYTDMSLVGEVADEKLPEYAEILRRVAASQAHDSFRVELDGHPCVIFSSETSNNWYLILSVNTDTLYGESYRQIAMLASVNLLMLALVAVYWLLGDQSARHAEDAAGAVRSIDGFSGRLRDSAAHLMRLGDERLFREGEDPKVLIGLVREAGEDLTALVNDLGTCAEALRAPAPKGEGAGETQSLEAPSRKVRNGVILSMVVSLVIVLAFCVGISINWGNSRMNREADSYENQLEEWLTQQRSILCMFTDVISADPEIMSDYEGAVRWLDDVSGRYPDISLCYMANPYAEHPVIMNNGWEPGEEERPETRPWYRETERSADGFNISAPYLDAQSGNYCVTLSRVVYGPQGEFLGIFGVDFFLDKLINVLGESYTSRSYAFLVDSDGVIINHPNAAYQMGEATATSIEDTEYADACHRQGVTTMRDYTSRLMACLSRKTGSGFTVVVANRWWNIYGSVVVVALVVLALFGACLGFVVALINRLIRWQAQTNRRLVAAAEEARDANRAKSQFLSQMSHEIRTPMNAIIGLDSIALRDGDLPPRARDALEKIGSSARHLLSLINDILDMSRIESGRMTLREDRFAFGEFLEQICVIVGGQCEDKGLRFVCNRVEPLDAWFVGDDLKLKQVLINILGNSVKFTEAPGVVTLTVAQTACADGRAMLRFTMEDTGIGMDKAFIPRLFEAFSQEDTSSTNQYGGSGLGMAITRSIVEMMGGEIGVESEKGLGTTFTVTVALGRVALKALPDAPAQAEGAPAGASIAGRRVLIAEDQELNAEVLTDLLEMEDVTCEWAENGQKAVEMFEKSAAGHFDAILMDMRMPVMDGLTAAREIRKLTRPDARTIPIVALTANAFEEDVRQCLEAGMNAHLSKPVDIDKLRETLGGLL